MSQRTVHNPTATRDNLASWLHEQGFKDEGQQWSYSTGTYHSYRRANVRVTFEDGTVHIFVFVGNDVLDYDVRLTNAPRGIVTTTLAQALGLR